MSIIIYWWITILKRKLPNYILSPIKYAYNSNKSKNINLSTMKIDQFPRKNTSFPKINPQMYSNHPRSLHYKLLLSLKNILINRKSTMKISTRLPRKSTLKVTILIQWTHLCPKCVKKVTMWSKRPKQTLQGIPTDQIYCLALAKKLHLVIKITLAFEYTPKDIKLIMLLDIDKSK